jgi:hypothetical protein
MDRYQVEMFLFSCSTDRQTDSKSDPHQDLRLYASALELEFVDWYDDEAKRDSILENRPASTQPPSALNDPRRLFKAVVNAVMFLRAYPCDTE